LAHRALAHRALSKSCEHRKIVSSGVYVEIMFHASNQTRTNQFFAQWTTERIQQLSALNDWAHSDHYFGRHTWIVMMWHLRSSSLEQGNVVWYHSRIISITAYFSGRLQWPSSIPEACVAFRLALLSASSEQRAASSEQRAASRASSKERAASSKQQAASSKQRASSSEQQAASSEQQTASSEQRAASSKQSEQQGASS
jgi:hypothetical protein